MLVRQRVCPPPQVESNIFVKLSGGQTRVNGVVVPLPEELVPEPCESSKDNSHGITAMLLAHEGDTNVVRVLVLDIHETKSQPKGDAHGDRDHKNEVHLLRTLHHRLRNGCLAEANEVVENVNNRKGQREGHRQSQDHVERHLHDWREICKEVTVQQEAQGSAENYDTRENRQVSLLHLRFVCIVRHHARHDQNPDEKKKYPEVQGEEGRDGDLDQSQIHHHRDDHTKCASHTHTHGIECQTP
mmetsp:Transcript_51060/g.136181  ORF Transcript_51060/g.136181 Transcript_51060/m.136181 type:complete len:243 (-) Transcript_51060:86-814(-)